MTPILALALAFLPAFSMAGVMPAEAGTLTKPSFDIDARAGAIVGGVAAAAGDFPYIVSLSQSGSHFCGGVLLNAYTVITAAHCSDFTASSVRVRAGSLTWASGGTQVAVRSILINTAYSDASFDSDIALWRLASPLAASSTIGYVTLPAQGSDPAAGTTLTTAGWGTTSESSSSLPAALRKVDVPTVSRTTCRAQYGTSAVTNNMICAGYTGTGGRDSCSGDSGGPIVDTATGVLVGLVSWGEGCAQADYAGVYTRVGNFVSWINTNAFTS